MQKEKSVYDILEDFLREQNERTEQLMKVYNYMLGVNRAFEKFEQRQKERKNNEQVSLHKSQCK